MSLNREYIASLIDEAKRDAKGLTAASATTVVLTVLFAGNVLSFACTPLSYLVALYALMLAWMCYLLSAAWGARMLLYLSNRMMDHLERDKAQGVKQNEESTQQSTTGAGQSEEQSAGLTADSEASEEARPYDLDDFRWVRKKERWQMIFFLVATLFLLVMGVSLIAVRVASRQCLVASITSEVPGPKTSPSPSPSPCLDCKELISRLENLNGQVNNLSYISLSPTLKPEFKAEIKSLFDSLFDKLEFIANKQTQINNRVETIQTAIDNRRYTTISIRRRRPRVNRCPCATEPQKPPAPSTPGT